MLKCPYCKTEAVWCENKVVYGRNYGKSYMIWLCPKCGAYTGCHQNTKQPLGTMANKELRELRVKCHELFDKIWKSGETTRKNAYKLLEEKTGIKHIAWANEKECELIIKLLTPKQ